MQRYFIDNDKIFKGYAIIENEDVHHIKDVMRFKVGDTVILNTFSGKVFKANIQEIRKKEVKLQIENEVFSEYKPLNLDLALAMFKKDNFELAIQKCTELGINKIIPIKTERSIIKLDDFSKKKDRFLKIVKEASEQSERTILPIIADYIKPSELNLEEYENKFVCFAREGSNLISREIKKSDLNGKTLVAIGPEGGFTEQEITQFISLGFISVSLGNTILRAETAAIYVTGLFRYLEEEKK